MPSTLEGSLTHAGFRATRQRRAVYEFLRDCRSHPTAEEICEGVRTVMPRISLATVYKALESLVTSGVAIRLEGEMSGRYDARLEPHYHARCLRCGSVIDVEPQEQLDRVLSGIEVPGFREARASLSLSGICGRCLP